MNKTTLFFNTLILAMSSFFANISFAGSHQKSTEEVEKECVTLKEFQEMTEEESLDLILPICQVTENKEAPES